MTRVVISDNVDKNYDDDVIPLMYITDTQFYICFLLSVNWQFPYLTFHLLKLYGRWIFPETTLHTVHMSNQKDIIYITNLALHC